jgi:hypothetical protein
LSAQQDIIEKVQKLLALATSPNENEAKLAAAKAHELLTKYNMSLDEVEASKLDEEYEAFDRDMGRSTQPREDRFIYSILQKFFYVKVLTHKFYEKQDSPYVNRQYRKRYKFTLVGRRHNVQIARYVYDFLLRAFRSSFLDFCRRCEIPTGERKGAVRNGYYHGLIRGLQDQLAQNLQKVSPDTTALVAAMKDPNIDKFIEDMFGKLKDNQPKRTDYVDQQALMAGYRQGQQMKIAMGIEADKQSDQQQIGQTLRLDHKGGS